MSIGSDALGLISTQNENKAKLEYDNIYFMIGRLHNIYFMDQPVIYSLHLKKISHSRIQNLSQKINNPTLFRKYMDMQELISVKYG